MDSYAESKKNMDLMRLYWFNNGKYNENKFNEIQRLQPGLNIYIQISEGMDK